MQKKISKCIIKLCQFNFPCNECQGNKLTAHIKGSPICESSEKPEWRSISFDIICILLSPLSSNQSGIQMSESQQIQVLAQYNKKNELLQICNNHFILYSNCKQLQNLWQNLQQQLSYFQLQKFIDILNTSIKCYFDNSKEQLLKFCDIIFQLQDHIYNPFKERNLLFELKLLQIIKFSIRFRPYTSNQILKNIFELFKEQLQLKDNNIEKINFEVIIECSNIIQINLLKLQNQQQQQKQEISYFNELIEVYNLLLTNKWKIFSNWDLKYYILSTLWSIHQYFKHLKKESNLESFLIDQIKEFLSKFQNVSLYYQQLLISMVSLEMKDKIQFIMNKHEKQEDEDLQMLILQFLRKIKSNKDLYNQRTCKIIEALLKLINFLEL